MRSLALALAVGLAALTASDASNAQVASPPWLLAELDALRQQHNGLNGQVHGDPPLCGYDSENRACCDQILRRRSDAIEGIARLARSGAISANGVACASANPLRAFLGELTSGRPHAAYLDGPSSPPIRCRLPPLRVSPSLRALPQRTVGACRGPAR
jgi:hypothetical protein